MRLGLLYLQQTPPLPLVNTGPPNPPTTLPTMDFEALKDQWSDVEDRDGIRLSWNTFPSSRMVCDGLEPARPSMSRLSH